MIKIARTRLRLRTFDREEDLLRAVLLENEHAFALDTRALRYGDGKTPGGRDTGGRPRLMYFYKPPQLINGRTVNVVLFRGAPPSAETGERLGLVLSSGEPLLDALENRMYVGDGRTPGGLAAAG